MSSGSPLRADRPRPVFLTAEWRWLAILNYRVDAALLADRVPTGTEVETWRGGAYLSLVGFRFLRTRVLGVPVPFHRDFDEVNLRFYVRRRVAEGWRRGVVFVRELVPKAALAAAARIAYGEPYSAVPMRHAVDPQAGHVSYAWRWQGVWESLALDFEGVLAPPPPDSEAAFITQHHWGYSRARGGGLREYQVEHPVWGVAPAVRAKASGELVSLYGSALGEALHSPPDSAFVADGSPIVVRRPSLIR
jgi:uncharacterized protein YqjF (DUF2071 family)